MMRLRLRLGRTFQVGLKRGGGTVGGLCYGSERGGGCGSIHSCCWGGGGVAYCDNIFWDVTQSTLCSQSCSRGPIPPHPPPPQPSHSTKKILYRPFHIYTLNIKNIKNFQHESSVTNPSVKNSTSSTGWGNSTRKSSDISKDVPMTSSTVVQYCTVQMLTAFVLWILPSLYYYSR
jgi:hypothetical protein